MIYKFELNFNEFNRIVYVNIPDERMGATEALKTMRAYVSEFKTYCIITSKPYNIPHFVNWFNKYKIYHLVEEFPTSGRIDF